MKQLLSVATVAILVCGGALFIGQGPALADHSGDEYNCDVEDFASQAEAQQHYREHLDDQDRLDGDDDGIACNGTDLPCPCDLEPVAQTGDDATPSPTSEATAEPTATEEAEATATAEPEPTATSEPEPTAVPPTATATTGTIAPPSTGSAGLR